MYSSNDKCKCNIYIHFNCHEQISFQLNFILIYNNKIRKRLKRWSEEEDKSQDKNQKCAISPLKLVGGGIVLHQKWATKAQGIEVCLCMHIVKTIVIMCFESRNWLFSNSPYSIIRTHFAEEIAICICCSFDTGFD